MLQPKFTPWPWGVLAVFAPVLAAAGAVMQYVSDPAPGSQGEYEQFWRAAATFFGLLGAANGYLIAIAIGDFGRSVLALPLGAAAGYATVFALHSRIAAGIAVAIYGMIIINAIVNGVRIVTGCAVCLLLALLLMVITVGSVSGESIREQNLLICYPIVCSLITASMPLERSVDGVFGAFLVGARASLHSMIAGLIGFAAVLLLFNIAGSFTRLNGEFEALLCGAVVGAMLANWVCIKSMFDVVYRVAPGMDPAVADETPKQTEKIDVENPVTAIPQIAPTLAEQKSQAEDSSGGGQSARGAE